MYSNYIKNMKCCKTFLTIELPKDGFYFHISVINTYKYMLVEPIQSDTYNVHLVYHRQIQYNVHISYYKKDPTVHQHRLENNTNTHFQTLFSKKKKIQCVFHISVISTYQCMLVEPIQSDTYNVRLVYHRQIQYNVHICYYKKSPTVH